MPFTFQPAYILAILLLLVVFSEWLGKKKFFRHLGPSLIIIFSAALLANLGIIPSSQNAPPLYSGIFQYIAPLAIFFLLLDVNLKELRFTGIPMLSLFILGSATTIAGVLFGYWLLAPPSRLGNDAAAIAGMYTGTYTGGSINFNAVAIQYGISKNGNLFATATAVDNIMGTLWIMVTLLLPALLNRFIPQKSKSGPAVSSAAHEELIQKIASGKEEINVMGIAALLLLGFATIFISDKFSEWFPAIPSILVLTTIALVLAQFSVIKKIKGGNIFGYFLVLVFLAVIGAYCDIRALSNSGELAGLLLSWVAVLILVHGVLIFLIGGLFKQDWDMIAMASNANVGGTATAAVCATSIGRPDLQLPGLLVASVGNALGTYLGVLVAEILK